MLIVHGYTIADIADIPRDDSLPGLGVMLDPEKFLTHLRIGIGDRLGVIEACTITYIRYKPKTNCLVAYELSVKEACQEKPKRVIFYAKLYTEDDYFNALDKSQKVRWIKLHDTPSILPLDNQLAILYFFPNDCLIDGLRILSDRKKVQRLLYDSLSGFPAEDWRISDSRLQTTTVRYKPERRAVIRVDTRAVNRHSGQKKTVSVYLRIYGDDRGLGVHALQKGFYEATDSNPRIEVPRPLGYVGERRLLMMEAVDGVDLLARLLDDDRSSVALTAKAISELHRSSHVQPPFRSIESLLGAAFTTGNILHHVAPETSAQVADILSHLAKYHRPGGPYKLVPLHGDFYYGQVLIQNHRAAIIDFDRSYFGEAAADIGNFCAHLRLLGIEGRVADAAGLESDFLEAYHDDPQNRIDEKSMRFYLAYCLFLLSIGSFRRLEAGWRQKTKVVLNECQRILQA